MAEIQNWISKSYQKFNTNSYFSKATSYVATHGDAAGWTFDESISKESVDEMIKKINEEQGNLLRGIVNRSGTTARSVVQDR
jgi:hypothetical protein